MQSEQSRGDCCRRRAQGEQRDTAEAARAAALEAEESQVAAEAQADMDRQAVRFVNEWREDDVVVVAAGGRDRWRGEGGRREGRSRREEGVGGRTGRREEEGFGWTSALLVRAAIWHQVCQAA